MEKTVVLGELPSEFTFHVALTHNATYYKWRDIGAIQQLATDEDIACYLMECYDKGKQMCAKCQFPLRLLCARCDATAILSASAIGVSENINIIKELNIQRTTSVPVTSSCLQPDVKDEENVQEPSTQLVQHPTAEQTRPPGEDGGIHLSPKVRSRVRRSICWKKPKDETLHIRQNSTVGADRDENVAPWERDKESWHHPTTTSDITTTTSITTTAIHQSQSCESKDIAVCHESSQQPKGWGRKSSIRISLAEALSTSQPVHPSSPDPSDQYQNCENKNVSVCLESLQQFKGRGKKPTFKTNPAEVIPTSQSALLKAPNSSEMTSTANIGLLPDSWVNWVCGVCGKKLCSKQRLVGHLTSQHPLAELPPSLAQYAARLAAAAKLKLPRKRRKAISRPQVKPNANSSNKATSDSLVCEMCGKKFEKRNRLNDHRRQCTRKVCHHCGEAVKNLIGHLKRHFAPRTYSCPRCSQSFLYRHNMEVHMRCHTGEKPFCCEICGMRYRLNASLQNHIRTHAGVKPFKCDQCDAAFTRSRGLRDHMRVHTGEKPYACQVCGRQFSSTGNLAAHRRKVHKMEPQVPSRVNRTIYMAPLGVVADSEGNGNVRLKKYSS